MKIKNNYILSLFLLLMLLTSGCTTVKGFFRGGLFENVISIVIFAAIVIWIIIRLKGRE